MKQYLRTLLFRDVIGLVLFAFAAALGLAKFTSVQSAQARRSIDSKVPAHVPLEIKIKPAKVEKIKDPNNKNWFRDLEIEIINTSERPIYYFNLFVEMKDVTNDTGATLMLPIIFGRAELVDLNVKPLPEDIPLLRNHTYTYVVSDNKGKAWEAWLKRNKKNDAMVLEITFNHLNFGDGTGLTSSSAIPIPVKQSPEDLARCLGKSPPAVADNWSKKPEIFSSLYASNLKPAASVPVNFSPADAIVRAVPAAPDICCPGTGCNKFHNLSNSEDARSTMTNLSDSSDRRACHQCSIFATEGTNAT